MADKEMRELISLERVVQYNLHISKIPKLCCLVLIMISTARLARCQWLGTHATGTSTWLDSRLLLLTNANKQNKSPLFAMEIAERHTERDRVREQYERERERELTNTNVCG